MISSSLSETELPDKLWSFSCPGLMKMTLFSSSLELPHDTLLALLFTGDYNLPTSFDVDFGFFFTKAAVYIHFPTGAS